MTDTQELFATAATADQADAGVGVIWWATHPPGNYALTVVDYDIADIRDVNAAWLGKLFERSAELADKHKPETPGCLLRVEHPGLIDVLERADDALRDTKKSVIDRSLFDVQPIREYEAAKWPATFAERMFAIRPRVDSGKIVKLETGLRRFSFRAIRTNHLISQIRLHRPGDAASAGELLQAFVLGVLLGTTPRSLSFFDAMDRTPPKSDPPEGPFGAYIPGRRPW